MISSYLQVALYIVLLVALVKPLGSYIARVYQGERTFPDKALKPVENLVSRWLGLYQGEMNWKQYAFAALVLNLVGIVVLYGLQRLQGIFPLNPMHFSGVPGDLAWNTAISFATNTNWQSYSGETTLSYLTQMLGLTVQNFLSAATGMAVVVALVRGFVRRNANTVGNFYVDLTRSVLYILLPLSLILAVVLVTQGVVQTLAPYQPVNVLQSYTGSDGSLVTGQLLPLGPAASQVAIKQLGTNGGGFYGVNSAHPFENPTPLSNFLEMFSILLIPAALCYTFGKMVGDTRQGWTILAVMLVVFVGALVATEWAEQQANPLYPASVDQLASVLQPGGNMEGKELRFGIANSALWSVATTAASNGSVNAMHDSYTPLGGLVVMWLIQLGEVIFGGVGSGLYGILVHVILAVFIAGLMVGRTPEYLGKKIQAFEVKMAALVILIPNMLVLVGTSIALMSTAGLAGIYNQGPHGFSEVLYAFSSAANNNGSAFAGLISNSPFYNILLGIVMFIGRYWLMIPVLAIAGSLVKKKLVPTGPGTLPTHTPLFAGWLLIVVLIIGALTFIPALALGPIIEQLLVGSGRVF